MRCRGNKRGICYSFNTYIYIINYRFYDRYGTKKIVKKNEKRTRYQHFVMIINKRIYCILHILVVSPYVHVTILNPGAREKVFIIRVCLNNTYTQLFCDYSVLNIYVKRKNKRKKMFTRIIRRATPNLSVDTCVAWK